MSVKNVRVEFADGYYVSESVDGKTVEGLGTRHWTTGAFAGHRYEGYFQKNNMNGYGMYPIPPNPPPPPNPIKCLLLLLLLLCVGGFLSLFCIRKENFY